MESLLSLLRMHLHLEPMAIPLTRRSDTLAPSGGEGWGEGGRGSWVASTTLMPRIGTMNLLQLGVPASAGPKPFEPPKGGTPNQPRFMGRFPIDPAEPTAPEHCKNKVPG